MRAPVLFLVFNRMDTACRVFEEIRKARPTRLFLASDGGRASRIGEYEKVLEVRRCLLERIDWECEVSTLFRESNLGCKLAVSSAITWFFEHVEEGIILEDDCLPNSSFFDFCDAALERYRHEEKVMCVSGDCFVRDRIDRTHSLYFTGHVHIWGWATWKRAWNRYEVDISADWTLSGAKMLEDLFPYSRHLRRFWNRNFDAVATGALDTWDYQWVYAIWKAGGCSCAPTENLISNIGFGADATHTHDASSRESRLPTKELEFPLRFPDAIRIDTRADIWEYRHVIGIGSVWDLRSAMRFWLKRTVEEFFPSRS